MKVLHIATTDAGGAGGATTRTHQHLFNAGVNSKLLTLWRTNREVPESYSYWEFQKSKMSRWESSLQKVRLKLHNFNTKRKLKGKTPAYELFSFPTSPFRKVCQHPLYEEADVVTLHWVAGFIDFPSFFRNKDKPIVWRMPDMFPFSGGYHYEAGLSYVEYLSLIQDNLECKKKALAGNDIYPIALCNWMYKKSHNSQLFGAYPHEIIPNGINTEIYKPYDQRYCRQVLGLPQDKKIILFAANTVTNKRKGFSILYEALKKIRNDHIGLAVIGFNAEKLKDQIANTFPIGLIKDDRLMAIAYSAADLYVIPSIEDNLPNTVIESISCGKPVVGFNIGGIPDMIISAQNGLLCDQINSNALAEAILMALETPFDVEVIRQDAVERFDQSVQAKRYIELYQKILEKR